MSWIEDLSVELLARGVPRRERTRIVLELGDHIACEPAGQPGDIYDDLPLPGWRRLRSRPWLLGALASIAAGLALGAFEAHAEHSVFEGLQRGVFEGVAAAVGFVVLGRAIGARPPRA